MIHTSKAQAIELMQMRYNELLYAVARKFEGETRHETALRYIREAELTPSDSESDLGKKP